MCCCPAAYFTTLPSIAYLLACLVLPVRVQSCSFNPSFYLSCARLLFFLSVLLLTRRHVEVYPCHSSRDPSNPSLPHSLSNTFGSIGVEGWGEKYLDAISDDED